MLSNCLIKAAAEYERQRQANGDDTEESSLALGEVLTDNKTIKCNENDECYTLWQHDSSNKDVITILKQGTCRILLAFKW